MSWHITPHGKVWALRKTGALRTHSKYNLRREAIAAARTEVKKKDAPIFVHNSSGMVTIRIPELPAAERVAAAVWIKKAGDMTPSGRKEIAAWLRKHASWLVKEGQKYSSNFRGRYYYSAPH